MTTIMLQTRRLFDFLHRYGPMWGNHFCIIGNNGPNAGEGTYYRVFVFGGIMFDIDREKEKGEWVYSLNIEWAGPYNLQDAIDIIAILQILGYSKELAQSALLMDAEVQ